MNEKYICAETYVNPKYIIINTLFNVLRMRSKNS